MHLLTWAAERSGVERAEEEGEEVGRDGRRDGGRGSKKLCCRRRRREMEAGVGDKETKRTKWRETRAASHSEQEQAKVNPRRENHFTAVTETTE